MAKQNVNVKSIEETLWDSANKLRGSVEPAEYKHVVLGLIFLKFASDKFEEHRKNLIAKGQEKYIEMAAFYNQSNVFFLDEISRWSYIIKNAKQNDIALKIDTALHNIEKNNKALKGALPDNYFSRLGLDITKLSSLLDTINDVDTLKDKEQDIVGRVYEYFLKKFAIAEGKGKGEFYTPKSIVNLIAEIIEPYRGIIYDPACGSGGMFVQSIKFIENHHGNKKEVSIYGQEYTNTTYKLAKMNLAIRGISGNFGEKAADTFGDDQHKDLKADYIMANPPFNQKDWRGENELLTDPRWRGYEVPPKSNANYAWILNMASKLSENGIAGFLLANGALSGGGDEYKIRRKLIENNLVEAILILPQDMFYTTNISVTLWILNKNKKAQSKQVGNEIRQCRDREKEVLFMDLRQIGEPYEKKFIQFSEQHIKDIAATFHTWQASAGSATTASTASTGSATEATAATAAVASYKDVPEYCYSATVEEIEKKDFSLVPSKYIEFVNRDENIDFDEKMKSLQTEFSTLLKVEEKSKQDLLKVFEELGYAIKL
jgi:type I restriction enzyme M protein